MGEAYGVSDRNNSIEMESSSPFSHHHHHLLITWHDMTWHDVDMTDSGVRCSDSWWTHPCSTLNRKNNDNHDTETAAEAEAKAENAPSRQKPRNNPKGIQMPPSSFANPNSPKSHNCTLGRELWIWCVYARKLWLKANHSKHPASKPAERNPSRK